MANPDPDTPKFFLSRFLTAILMPAGLSGFPSLRFFATLASLRRKLFGLRLSRAGILAILEGIAGDAMKTTTMLLTLACLPLVAMAAASDDRPTPKADVLFAEDFSAGMDRWWAEGGEKVWVEDGRLRVNSDPPAGMDDPHYGATVWCKQQICGDVRITCDAHVISSSVDANNINFFLFFSDPEGKRLEETASQRADAEYRDYHELNGYIVTYLNANRDADPADARARVRIRRCPGFELQEETFAHHCRAGRTYHFEIVRRGKRLVVRVDGRKLLEAKDPKPHESGIFGFRTFRTRLWWDDIRVERIAADSR